MCGSAYLPYRVLLVLVILVTMAWVGVPETRAECGDYVVVGGVPQAALRAHDRELLFGGRPAVPSGFASGAAEREFPSPCRGPGCDSRDASPPQPVSNSVSRSTDFGSSAALVSGIGLTREARKVRVVEPRLSAVHIHHALLRPPEPLF